MEITEKTTFEAWKKALKYIMDYGSDFTDKDDRICREVLNLVVNVENPSSDFEKPIDIMQQFEWVYPTKEELSSIIFNKEESATYEFSAGSRIFNYQKVRDQINDFVIPLLRKDPNSRRAIISLFNPITDADISSKDIPSLMIIYFKIVNDTINLTCVLRSNDFFVGWPGNSYQMMMLQRYVAEKIDVKAGKITTMSGSAHMFHENFDMINKILVK
jgi:thymidylate synthase